MALIKCPACGQTISNKAARCPKCGEPIDKQASQVRVRRTWPWVLVCSLLAVAVIALVCVLLFSRNSAQSEPPKPENDTLLVKKDSIPEKLGDREFSVNGVAFKMVYVEGGTFTMGCTSEQSDCNNDATPVHGVTLSDFMIGETEVTQALWKAVMGSEPTCKDGWTDRDGHGLTYPAYRVAWDDCQMFIRELNSYFDGQLPSGWRFALPTEAQWEYAARGGSYKSTYKYAGGNNIDDLAWYTVNTYDLGKENPNYGTHPVKSKGKNVLGLYDMSGNVWEWCQDVYDKDYYSVSPSNNPVCQLEGPNHVLRGGCWINSAKVCQVAFRKSGATDGCGNGVGFRLALVHQ